MYRRVLVPLDGSKVAEGVLPHAKALAYGEGAEIVLLSVAENPVREFSFADPAIAESVVQAMELRTRKYVAEVEAQLKKDGFNASSVVQAGAAADVILRVAEETRADVIAMSTNGRTGAARWLIGSVADRVARNSKVPVMLIRARA
jgi:nucleotide-binding universal stress UspA family protein